MALIIAGHPDFDKSVANKIIIEQLQKSTLNLEIRQLQKMYPDFSIDVKEEQAAVARHQTIVLQYPVYWYSMPAILKHWFDQVFSYQFAYGPGGDKIAGKNMLPCFTVGSAEKNYTTLGVHHFPVYEFCKGLEQTAHYTKMNYLSPIYFHDTFLSAGVTTEQVKHKAIGHAKKIVDRLTVLEK
jgi:putative NADPH-quinone reductase